MTRKDFVRLSRQDINEMYGQSGDPIMILTLSLHGQ